MKKLRKNECPAKKTPRQLEKRVMYFTRNLQSFNKQKNYLEHAHALESSGSIE